MTMTLVKGVIKFILSSVFTLFIDHKPFNMAV